jgi:GNAT superfamily N-acetyltransferase
MPVPIEIDVPQGKDELTEFVQFHDRAYAYRSARWEANLDMQLPILLGESPFARQRELCPFVARDGGEIVARAAALMDPRYVQHWNEQLGHIVWFEALPETREEVRLLIDRACAWLAERGALAARTGFTNGVFDLPFAIDAYETLPPSMLRQNPAHYHVLIKQAGFEVEQGFVDYKLRVTPQLVERWQGALEGARRGGFEIVPLGEVPRSQRIRDFTETFNDTFKSHWGWVPFLEEEISWLLDELASVGVLDTSVLAYQDGEPVGALFVPADDPEHVKLAPGRVLDDSERLNALGIGVRDRARGRGVNHAMAGYAYLELARRGRTHLSYTLVLDDNWPSRRTGEGLGASICANYLAYRRNFRS